MNSDTIFGFGFTLWKQKYIQAFLGGEIQIVNFVWTYTQAVNKGVNKNSNIINWGQRAIDEAYKTARQFDIPLGRVEDGFIRSVGLGSDLTPPLSLVVDKTGIYYDPTQPSDLESLLETYAFTDELIMRAANIKKMLLENAVSKYNVGKKLVSNLLQNQAGQ